MSLYILTCTQLYWYNPTATNYMYPNLIGVLLHQFHYEGAAINP